MNEFIITTVVGILTGMGGWFTARKRNKAETKITELEVVEKAVAVWRQLSEDLQKRYESMQNTYDELRKRYDDVLQRQSAIEDELEGLREDNMRLVKENKALIQKLKKFQPDA